VPNPMGGTTTHVGSGGAGDPQAPPSQYTMRFDDDASGVAYLGEAATGAATASAVWRIKKITTTGIDIVILWADGNTNFDNVWDNHLTLSYS
jgi:hypothetical protein